MTLISFARRDAFGNSRAVALKIRPTVRLSAADHVVTLEETSILVQPRNAGSETGGGPRRDVLDLASTLDPRYPGSWAWRIEETDPTGRTAPFVRTVLVPLAVSSAPISDSVLVAVDPASLAPSARPTAAWDTALQGLQAQLDAATGLDSSGVATKVELTTALAEVPKLDSAGRLSANVLPSDVVRLVDGKVASSQLPASSGTGGPPAADSLALSQFTPEVRAKIAAGGVADGTLTSVKLAPLLAGSVKVPEFVPQDQTTLLGLPTAYVRASSPTITRAQIGLSSIYWPYLVRVPESEFARLPQFGRWRLYCSTDHDKTSGAIAVLKTDAVRPGDPDSVWTSIKVAGSSTIFKRGGGDQVETPTVIFNAADPAGKPWYLYHQIQGRIEGGFTPQRTDVARSANGIDGWEVVEGAGVPNPDRDWLGWRHTGYMRVWLIDGQWVAYCLSGGGDLSSYGWAYSNDGFSWNMDRRRIYTAGSWGGGIGRLGVSTVMRYRGGLWGVGRVSGYASGTNTAASSMQWIAPLRDDLLGPVGRLQQLPYAVDAGITGTPSAGPCMVADANGSLWSAYRAGDAQSAFRFIEVK